MPHIKNASNYFNYILISFIFKEREG